MEAKSSLAEQIRFGKSAVGFIGADADPAGGGVVLSLAKHASFLVRRAPKKTSRGIVLGLFRLPNHLFQARVQPLTVANRNFSSAIIRRKNQNIPRRARKRRATLALA